VGRAGGGDCGRRPWKTIQDTKDERRREGGRGKEEFKPSSTRTTMRASMRGSGTIGAVDNCARDAMQRHRMEDAGKDKTRRTI